MKTLIFQSVLPDPETVIDDAETMAWEDGVLPWSAAAVGLLLVVLVIKSFLAR